MPCLQPVTCRLHRHPPCSVLGPPGIPAPSRSQRAGLGLMPPMRPGSWAAQRLMPSDHVAVPWIPDSSVSAAHSQRTLGFAPATSCWGWCPCCTWCWPQACSSTASSRNSVPGRSGGCSAACPTAGAWGRVGAWGRGWLPRCPVGRQLSCVPSTYSCQEPCRGASNFQKPTVHAVLGGTQAFDSHALRPPVLLGVYHPLGRHQGGHLECACPQNCLSFGVGACS